VRRARRVAARRGRRLRIMFTDEARFGRMNRPRPCWAPTGIRPGVAAQLIREYIYLYGAVSPKDGICVYLIMPTSNTECRQERDLARCERSNLGALVCIRSTLHSQNIRLLWSRGASACRRAGRTFRMSSTSIWDSVRASFRVSSPSIPSFFTIGATAHGFISARLMIPTQELRDRGASEWTVLPPQRPGPVESDSIAIKAVLAT
jgi:hypothetical protein